MNEVRAQGEVCGRHYSSGEFMKLEWDGGVITRFESVDVEPRVWLAPGLFDLQINGFGGIDFQQDGLSLEDLLRASRAPRATGCPRFLLTPITPEGKPLPSPLPPLPYLNAQPAQ